MQIQLTLMYFERDSLTNLFAYRYPGKMALGHCAVFIKAIRVKMDFV